MRTLILTEPIERALSGILEELKQGRPVVLRRGDEDVGAVISMADYERLHAQSIEGFAQSRAAVATAAERSGLTEEKLAHVLR